MNLQFASQMFAVGLVTSIHCVFMCGCLVLTYAVKGTEGGSWYRRLLPHLAYQGSKILSYAAVALILGGLLALAGSAVDISPVRNWLQVVAGTYMVLLGVGMTGKVKVLRYLTPRPPKFLVDALSKNRKKASADAAEGHASLVTPIMFGLLTGLMPCAPLIAAQASAVSQASVLTGVLGMAAFGLGTAPLMLLFGFVSSLLSRQFQAKMQIVAAIAVVIFGLVILNRGLMLVGSPVTFDSVKTAIVGTSVAPGSSDTQFTTGADGVVEVNLAIIDTAYVPETLAVPADTKVRILVDRQEDLACSDQLVINAAGVKVDLAPNGVTKVDLPPMPAGSYQMTCGMGMMSGTLLVGGAAAAAAGAPAWLIALLVVGVGGAGYALWRRRSARLAAAAKASAKGAGRKGSSKPAASAAERTGLLGLGFEPAELVLGGAIVVLAIIIGLASGGFFR